MQAEKIKSACKDHNKECPMRGFYTSSFLWFFVLGILILQGCSHQTANIDAYLKLGYGSPEEAGIDSRSLQDVDKIIQEAIEQKHAPGAVLLIGKDNKIVYFKAYGNRRIKPRIDPMTKDTIFDLASCSKILGTSTMTMLLLQQGKITLDTKVADILPQFAQKDKGDVTVWNLLTHTSGLPPYCNWKDAEEQRGDKTTADAMIDYISSMEKRYPTGEYYLYSCLNFQTLARVMKKWQGKTCMIFSNLMSGIP